MADHTWEDDVEPAVSAAMWVLERLYDTFDMLNDNDLSEHGEFEIAANDTRKLIDQLVKLNNDCFDRRGGELGEELVEDDLDEVEADEEVANVDVEEVMKKAGLKQVDGIHYKEEVYTGTASGLTPIDIGIADYLKGDEKWEDVLKRAKKRSSSLYPILDSGPVAERVVGSRYNFLYYSPSMNLMSGFVLLHEEREDENGNVALISATWKGLSHRDSYRGVVTISERSTGETKTVASRTCTHFSQLIKLVETIPTPFSLKDVSEKWGEPVPTDLATLITKGGG